MRRLARMAGFAVHYQHLPAELLTLRDLCDPALVHEFIQWWVEERRRKLTPGLRNMVVNLEVIARHWLKDLTIAEALKDLLKGDLAVADAVRDKQTRWLSLAQIDAVGQTVYPLNPTRLHDFWEARTIQRHLADPTRYPLPSKTCNLMLYAYWAGVSLILRFLVRRPLRQRNIREMTLQRNLYQDHEGVWRIRFSGQELKVDRRDGGVNRYECVFPPDLVPLLEEYLTIWRPRLAKAGEEHVFLNSKGHPFSANRLTGVVAVTTMRFARVGVTPHMIRDIFATEYLKQHPGDAAGRGQAARQYDSGGVQALRPPVGSGGGYARGQLPPGGPSCRAPARCHPKGLIIGPSACSKAPAYPGDQWRHGRHRLRECRTWSVVQPYRRPWDIPPCRSTEGV